MNVVLLIVAVIVLASAAAFYFMSQGKKASVDRTEDSPAAPATTAATVKKSQPMAKEQPKEEPVKTPGAKEAHPGKGADQTKNSEKTEKAGKAAPRKNYGRDLYNYINQAVRSLHICNVEDRWDSLEDLGTVPEALHANYQEIRSGLKEKSRQLLDEAASCLDFVEKDGQVQAVIRDKDQLKELFYQNMLPFYEKYADVLGEGRVKHSSLIGQNALNLFHDLTGRRFRVGYHNRYNSGVTAFEKNGDVYRVYNKEATLLCDATFKNRRIENGYALVPRDELSDDEWTVYEAGNYENGDFTGGVTHYHYNVECR